VSVDSFDVVVVGAGPAGSAAALVLARAGHSVCLLERGPFPGAKNMYGGVIYAQVLDGLVPDWRDRAPVQRWITRRSTMLITESQALAIDFRSESWGRPPYNGATAYRPEWDRWLAGCAEAAGAVLVSSTTATGLLRDAAGRVAGVRTDRADGDVAARLVIACDGVNSFLAKEAGLFHNGHAPSEHVALGVKEVLRLGREEIDKRFNVSGRDGVEIELVGATQGIPGGGFVYTNLDTVAVGVVIGLDGLAASGRRPEEVVAALKRHPAIAPLVTGGELVEYSAHLVPEGGYNAMPALTTDGMLVAGDAAFMTLATGIWLEGVNFAIASGAAAAETAIEALDSGDLSRKGLAGYRRRLEQSFVLRDHRNLRRAPKLVLGERLQRRYPQLMCDLVEALFTVDNTAPKPGLRRLLRAPLRRAGVRKRDLLRDAIAGWRIFG
jgi:electron transfer flavoprotein-quinone oxidoreductase